MVYIYTTVRVVDIIKNFNTLAAATSILTIRLLLKVYIHVFNYTYIYIMTKVNTFDTTFHVVSTART